MLLSMEDVDVLSKCTTKIGEDKYLAKEDKYLAKDDISEEDKERLRGINELSEISYGEKMITNI